MTWSVFIGRHTCVCVCSSFVCESLCWCMRCVCLRACACVPLFVVWSEHKTGIHTSHNGVRGQSKRRAAHHTRQHTTTTHHPPSPVTQNIAAPCVSRPDPKIKGVKFWKRTRSRQRAHTRCFAVYWLATSHCFVCVPEHDISGLKVQRLGT